MQNPSSNRNIYIDIVKGVTMLLVIYGHAMEASGGAECRANLDFFNDRIHDFIFSFHMPLFMLISGYLFCCSFLRHDTRYLVMSRMRSLLIPIISFGIVVAFIKMDYANISFTSTIRCLVTSITRNLWFLYAVLILSLISLFIERKLNGKLFCYMIAICLTFFIPPHPFLLFNKEIAFMCPYFIAGLMFKRFQKNIVINDARIIKVFFMSLVLFVIIFNYWTFSSYIYTSGVFVFKKDPLTHQILIDYNQILIDIYRYVIGFLGSIMILSLIYVLIKLGSFSVPFIRDFLVFTGKKTMGLYCFHFIGTIWLERMSVTNVGIDYGYTLFCSFALYAFAMFFTCFFEQWSISRLMFLGGR